MKIFGKDLIFDEGLPFYGLVIAYLSQVHGFIDLASRGLRIDFAESTKNASAPKAHLIEQFCSHLSGDSKEHCRAVVSTESAPLIGKQRLGSREDDDIDIDIQHLASEAFRNYESPVDAYNRMSGGVLLIMAWEVSCDYRTEEPIWEFHRHCRNAAAHNGKFVFRNGGPAREAKWRELRLSGDLDGSELFINPEGGGFIRPGDVLYLLWDLENKFMK